MIYILHFYLCEISLFQSSTMNQKQNEAFMKVVNGESIFLTGPAGTGKSFTLQQIIKWARHSKKEIGITASTGLAAYLIKGRTIHSFLGIGLGKKSAEALAEYVKKKSKNTYNKLINMNILLLDEISMIEDELLDKISEFLSIIRGDNKPFGGVQVVLSGDFCQLPPVSGKYCFLSDIWKKADIQTIVLEELIRQDKDTKFQDILQELRWGICSKDTLKLLKSLKNKEFNNDVMPTKLYSVNVDVDKINKKEFDELVEKGAMVKNYKTKYSSHPSAESWAQSLKIPDHVELCIGAQVLVTWNLQNESSIVNGTRGIITDFCLEGPKVKLIDGREIIVEYMKLSCEDNEKITVTFIPLKLAYAISIHKSQGMTLDAMEIDLGTSIFEYGQAYTALSRAKSLDNIKIISVKSKSFMTHSKVKDFYRVKIT